MISKELLSEVLNVEISEVNGTLTHKNNKSLLSYTNKDCSINDGKGLINIYELAHKCKDWAFDNGYELRSGRDIDVKEELCYFCEYKQERQLDYAYGNYFLADTETESIFKACQWILNNKES